MRTMFETPEKYAREALRLAREIRATGECRPTHFRKVMQENCGMVNVLSPYGQTDDGLERKNPVIVALGDSVTAGHFEFSDNPEEFFAKAKQGCLGMDDIVEITDARVCYLEQFRAMLIDKYQQTSVSTINAGIAGDTMYGMKNRLYRDVIRYQPDLVILNGSLNWSEDCGDTEAYRKVLTQVVASIQEETKADLVLLTPNMELPEPVGNPHSTLKERVEIIRELAVSRGACLADAYMVWEAYEAAGYPLEALLANKRNHPSAVGHTMYALVLMQLME